MAELDSNKNLAVRYMEEVFNQRKFDVLSELYAPEALETVRPMTVGFLSAFPDWHGTIEDLFAEGDRVVNRWVGHGTNTQPLMGMPPTGKAVTLEGITIFKVADGKVVQQWSQADQLSLMRQLGVVP
ncbi:MAG TPA: ester cyclase [Vicinamibacterales bacterium]|nr:ester cyclase [Vicinamibacterales bacterium]